MCSVLKYEKIRVSIYNWKNIVIVRMINIESFGDFLVLNRGKEMMLLVKIINLNRIGFGEN